MSFRNYTWDVLGGNNATKYHNDFLKLLSQLSPTEDMTVSDFLNCLAARRGITTILLLDEDKIIATGSMLLETKFTHFQNKEPGKVCHIEDVVVDENYRGQGLGKTIVNELCRLAKQTKCYKIILDCTKSNVLFYEKCGFHVHETSMRMDIDE